MPKFSDRFIKSLKAKPQRYDVREGAGFVIRIFPSGVKTWCLVYTFMGKKKRMALGNYPAMALKDARALHGEMRASLDKGIDPAELSKIAKQEEDASRKITVEFLVGEYIERWAKPRKRTWKEDERMLLKDVVPRWGKMRAKDVSKKDILRLLDDLLERGATTTANRTLAVVRKMFNWAVERGELDLSPCVGIRSPSKENRRERILSEDQIKSFWDGLEKASMTDGMRLAFKLQLLTAQRKGEVIGAPWSEFDLENGWWLIPSERSKNGVANHVPLSKKVLILLGAIKFLAGDSPWLFPSGRTQTHVIETSADHAIRNNLQHFNAEQFTPHDLRRTAASHMTKMGISRLVVSKILNHVDSSVTAIYDRHSYDKEKRHAMDAWARKLDEIITGKKDSEILEFKRK
ncbi:MAG: tyrosine-type recombinase/integrase [Magnetococcales bacterium]|nr:tyrosine-type recombinase/integrase [Magnetococcales bacterium]